MADIGPSFGLFWPKFGKQERTAQVPLFHVECGPDESVRCGPDLDLRNFAIWDVFMGEACWELVIWPDHF